MPAESTEGQAITAAKRNRFLRFLSVMADFIRWPYGEFTRFSKTEFAINQYIVLVVAALGAGVAMLTEHHLLGLIVTIVAVVCAAILLVRAFLNHREFVSVRESLGNLLLYANELMSRSVKDKSEYDRWFADYDAWYKETCKFLEEKLSVTDSAMFAVLPGSGSYSMPGFNSDHMTHKNILLKYIGNLRGVTDRYLAVH